MADSAFLIRTFSHDPTRRLDRFPSGAVPAGTEVALTLRADKAVLEHVQGVQLEVDDPSCGLRRIEMEPCEEGYRALLDTAGEPRVLFYRFVVQTDFGCVVYAARTDGVSTAGSAYVSEAAAAMGTFPVAAAAGRPMFPLFQLTVYDPGFTVPEWYSGSIMYQIFPDRFARGPEGVLRGGVESHAGRGWPVDVHEDWNEPPAWGESYDPVDFFGGTLFGIEDRLDYLSLLGVEVLYLNPICEARSNHRYNTGDYMQVDPILGTWDDFERLADAAAKRGMRIMLDTVLSHTGASSRYFNLDGSYDSFGAAQGEGSPYRAWYDFAHSTQYAPYRCWWNDPTLPEVEEHDPSWQEFVFGTLSDGASGSACSQAEVRLKPKEPRNPLGPSSPELVLGDDASRRGNMPPEGPDGLLAQWVAHGAGGFRLDVADEIPDDVLEMVRTAAKAASPDSVVIGEVWEDPTTKESYGSRRSYALGRSLDSVMNYPLRAALLRYALGNADAQQLETFLKMQKSNYPEPLYRGLMNLLSSHDVERVRSVLDLGMEFRDRPRSEQAAMVSGIDDAADARGARLHRMLACLVYMLPGVPCLYYGDEKGMQGGRDPFDRATFPWDGWRPDCGRDLTAFYQALGKMRSASDVLKRGTAAFYSYGKDVACVLRMTGSGGSFDNGDAAGGLAAGDVSGTSPRPCIDGALLCVANRSDVPVDFVFDLVDVSSGLTDAEARALRFSRVNPRCVFTTDESGVLPECGAVCEDGIFSSSVGPMQALVFQLDSGLQKPMGKGLGVICHVTSVPNEDAEGNRLGHGTLGAPARRFVDMLAECGVRYWQTLPLNPTDEYGSPYAGLSAFAGNPRLLEAGTEDRIARGEYECAECEEFVERNRKWLIPYAAFVAIKDELGGALWRDWPKEYHDWDVRLAELPQLADGIRTECMRQFAFERQWKELRAYANGRGVKIVGDMPIYVSADSADAWVHREYLTLDAEGNLTSQGGVPPDQFAEDGQLWGNPTYDWDALEANGYDWWLDRFERAFEWYDFVRSDHFLGFESYYSVPSGKGAGEGEWLPGPGIGLFRSAYDKFGPLPVIAEDLGIITPEVRRLLAETGFPGMDVVQFFDGDPLAWWRPKPGKACFTSTHDTSTLVGWVKKRYCGDSDDWLEEARRMADGLVSQVVSSPAQVVFLSLQDVLGLDDSARMNTPGTTGGNWQWQAAQRDVDACRDRLRAYASTR